ncbi:NAD(P)-dependent oxidoreductase [Gemella sp. zg-1178]|uniref:NAD(P)-dependent oxidoreductase n=1 Tax=Gemella sp. zg-1178 TaxID=2840372 RepID=UPI001C03D1CC|nr:NAD(P)-dependent oxidoreductase [Gemella sp. zg-1178]MBU0278888.1 NAD(P)-dependent oxidoreductase [Gemella sp. zg-1178]
MKVAVLSSNGKVGSLVVDEFLSRGHEVTGFSRSENKSNVKNFIKKDIFDLTKEDLAGYDVVVDAFGVWTEEEFPLFTKVTNHLSEILAGSSVKLLIVGGAGSLYVDSDHKVQLLDTPDFPAEFYPLAKAMTDALAVQRTKNDVDWVFISPAADFVEDGEKTGQYIIAGEVFTVNEKGESIISYADYAAALVDIAESGKYSKERISLLGK